MDGTDDRHPEPVPMLRGQHVWLRPSEPEDVDRFVGWLSDAETSSFLMLRSPIARAAEERWIDRMIDAQGKDGYHFVICRLEDDLPIGTIGLHDLDLVNGAVSVGIAIGEKRLWGRGYGTDAVNAIVDFAFGQLRLERVWLDVYAFNTRARASYRKSGFTVEGTLRRGLFRNGTYHDVLRMALLRDEWQALTRPRSWDLNQAHLAEQTRLREGG